MAQWFQIAMPSHHRFAALLAQHREQAPEDPYQAGLLWGPVERRLD